MIVSNHCGWTDILVHMARFFPAFVARDNTKNLVMIGLIRQGTSLPHKQLLPQCSDVKVECLMAIEYRSASIHHNYYEEGKVTLKIIGKDVVTTNFAMGLHRSGKCL